MAEATTLVKYVAAYSGYSRRNAADLIKGGKVTVNGSIIIEPWHEVVSGDDIRVEGKRVEEGGKVYFLLNKPAGYITSMEDDLGRQDVSWLMRNAAKERIFPIGRLDKDTTGLLLFTNDGELAQRVSHPRFKMKKEYQVTLDRPVNPEHLKTMFKGVFLPDGLVRVDRAAFMSGKRKYVVILEIHSGKKHVIRRLFRHFGYDVRQLDRISYAGLTKKALPLGKWRALTSKEVETVQKMAETAAKGAPKPRRRESTKSRGGRPSSDRRWRKDSSFEKRTPKLRNGKRVERPELRRKKELIVGTEEWFAQDDAKPVERSRSRDDRYERSDDKRSRTRDDRKDSKAHFRRSDAGAPKRDYGSKRPSRSNKDRQEQASWREQRESSFDAESWFNEGDDERPRRRTDFRDVSHGSTGRSGHRDDRAQRPSGPDKRRSGVDGEAWSYDTEDAKPRTRSKSTTSRTRSTSKSKALVRTKPAHKRTKPGGGGKLKSRGKKKK